MAETSYIDLFLNENRTLFTIIALFAGLSSYIFSFYSVSKNDTLLASIVSLYFFVASLTLLLYYKTVQYVVEFKPTNLFQKALLFLIISLLFSAIISLGFYFYSTFPQDFIDRVYISIFTFFYIFISGVILFYAYKIPSIDGCKMLRKILYVSLIVIGIVGIILVVSPKKLDNSVFLFCFMLLCTIIMSIIFVSVRISDFK